MNAAERLFNYLGNPRGQLVIHLGNSAEGQKELVVWARHGYDRQKIPSSFGGYKVIVQEMPHLKAQAATSHGLACN